MVYRAIGLMSGSSLDGLDIAFVHLQEGAGKWSFEIIKANCYSYTDEWRERLKSSTTLNAREYLLLHTAYGHYLGEKVNQFIEENNLHYQVQLISSHGHTSFHMPAQKMTAQLGDGAAIAAVTGINTVSDLRAMDVALGGQGAPLVPTGEKLLFSGYDFFLNLGGIANLSFKSNEQFIGFDVCPANAVLNMLANKAGKAYDANGDMASAGNVNEKLLEKLNALSYYADPYPKSLANDFGTGIVYPLIQDSGFSIADGLRTYTEHIVLQIAAAIAGSALQNSKPLLLVTGGGAFNTFLIERLKYNLAGTNVQIIVPDENIIQYKEALIMALTGILRWREEYNVMASVTGASRNSIGGSVWMGQEA